MESIEYSFKYTKKDYKKLLTYVYKKYVVIFLILFLSSIFFGSIDFNNSRIVFNFEYFFDWILLFLVFIALIVYVYITLMRRYLRDPRLIETKRLKINEIGIEIESDNALIRILWNEISKIDKIDAMVFVRYNRKKILCIPDQNNTIDVEIMRTKINLTTAST